MAMCPQEDQNKERPSERQHWPSSLHSVYFNSLLTFRFLSSSQYSLRIFNTNPTYDLIRVFSFPAANSQPPLSRALNQSASEPLYFARRY
jgi:hypothetical protein